MRLNKFISLSGFASRRAADKLIEECRVKVNGSVVENLGTQVDELKDKIEIDGKVLKLPKETSVILFHKPPGCVTSKNDPQGRPTIYDFLPSAYHTMNYIGRLDLQSRGLLLLTDDGELLYRLTHPSYEIPRSYNVWTTRELSDAAAQKLVDGVNIAENGNDEEIAFATDVYLENGFAELTLIEGKNREIRRMMKVLGYEIRDLKRISYAGISLGDLAVGDYRKLTEKEMQKLYQAVNL